VARVYEDEDELTPSCIVHHFGIITVWL
jgi:hypothetical protein